MHQVTEWIAVVALLGLAQGELGVEWTSTPGAPWCSTEAIGGLPQETVRALIFSLPAPNQMLRHCEVRETSIEAPATSLMIDGLQYGGIRVEGWSRPDVRLRARVRVWGLPPEPAAKVARGVEIVTHMDRITARGPSVLGEYVWIVDYDVTVPYESDVTLQTGDGGIHVKYLRGIVLASADSGGIVLHEVAGDVRARTARGVVSFDLATQLRDGESVSLDNGEGPIEIRLARQFSGELALHARNGMIRVDFPGLVSGTLGGEVKLTVFREGARVQATAAAGNIMVREH